MLYLGETKIRTVGIITGGRDIQPKDVNFWDYEGTLIASYTKAEALTLTGLPPLPDRSDENLTNDGWNWTLSEINTQLNNVGGEVNVGCTYHTSDDKTYLYVTMYKNYNTISVQLNPSTSGSVTIDWGDGSLDEDLLDGKQTISHTYNIASGDSAVDYIITIISPDGCIFDDYLFGSQTNNQDVVCKEIKLSNTITTLGPYVFAYLFSLERINIPEGTISSGTDYSYTFYYSYGLSALVVPRSITSMGTAKFGFCSSMKVLCQAATVTYWANYICRYSYSLAHVTLPYGMTNLGQNGFQYNYGNLGGKIYVGPNVTNIGSAFFGGATYFREIYINRSTPPTIQSTTLSSDLRAIYVPSSAVNTYKGASYWSDYASIIQAIPS